MTIVDESLLNPFYFDSNTTYLSEINKKDLHKLYEYVYVLCLKDHIEITDEVRHIFDKFIDKIIFENLSKYFDLIKCSKKLLNNKIHAQFAKIIMKDDLYLFGTNFENSEIIIPMLELKSSQVVLYNNSIEPQSNLEKFLDISSTGELYNINSKKMNNLLLDLSENYFWKNKYNCDINMTETFIGRMFTHKENDVVTTVNIDSVCKMQNYKNLIDYQLNNTTNLKYSDIGCYLKYKTNRSFYATDTKKLKITCEIINKYFMNQTNEKNIYDFFNSLIISKDYCHLVLNNKVILDKMKDIFNKYSALYKYLLGYAFITLYIEENIFKNKTTLNDRFVFDIDTANKLPVFPFCYTDIHQNPYFPVMISKNEMKLEKNYLSMTSMNYDGYGITNLTEFKKRINMFTTGTIDKNIFDGIDWKHFAITGSIMVATLQNRPILLDYVYDNNKSELDNWMTFFKIYYENSDIDLMCNKNNVFEYMEQVNNVISILEKNIYGKITVSSVKTFVINMTRDYIEEYLDQINSFCGLKMTTDEIINNFSNESIKKYFYSLYSTEKIKNNAIERQKYKDKFYDLYFSLATIKEMHLCCGNLYQSSKDNQVSIMSKGKEILRISENIKFKLSSSKMLHNIEIFKINGTDFFSTVNKFHLPCVRSYYNGTNVYMLTSCVSALMTNVNIDYKYFASVRSPIEIIQKYRERGFSTILNKYEKSYVKYYMKENNPNVKNIFGAKKMNDELFKLKHSNNKYKDIDNMTDLFEIYKTNHNYDKTNNLINMFEIKYINDEGYIEPYKFWIPEAFYYSINKK